MWVAAFTMSVMSLSLWHQVLVLGLGLKSQVLGLKTSVFDSQLL